MAIHYLYDTLILLAAAVVVVPLAQGLRLGSVLGFLIAGMVIGPQGLGFIHQVDQIAHLAEFGVVFLLFIIGVELKPSRLWRMRRLVFGLGSLQVVVGTALLGGLALLGGVSPAAALIVGAGLALSSTAFVLQLLAERKELAAHHGRVSFAVLLLQDMAVVPLLAMVPLIAAQGEVVGSGLGLALAQALGILVVILAAGRFLLRPYLKRVATAGNPELFVASALLLVLGASALAEQAGLSMAMGAFLAGLLIADTEYRHQVLADIQPFRGLLLGLFFIAVGMGIDLGLMAEQPGRLALLLCSLLAVKSALLFVLARAFGIDQPASLKSALLMAQAGEFGFVLFGVAHRAGLLDAGQFQELVLVVALGMAVTPLLAALADRVPLAPPPADAHIPSLHHEDDRPPVLIAGFGRGGRRVAEILRTVGYPCIGVERRAELVSEARERGHEVLFGDAGRADVLKAAGAGKARLVIVTLNEPAAADHVVTALHQAFPHLPIYVRGHDRGHCAALMERGATVATSENLEASLQLAREALSALGIDDETAEARIRDFRNQYYRVLAGP